MTADSPQVCGSSAPTQIHLTNGAAKNATASTGQRPARHFRIVDIRRSSKEISLVKKIYEGLNPKPAEGKTLPTLLLYDERGLKLFEDITYLEEYYLTNTEIAVLERYADNIAEEIKPGSILLELGSGNLRKVNILLAAIEKQQKSVQYYALDLSRKELERTLSAIPSGSYKYIECIGLHGTYDDGLHWLQSADISAKPKLVLHLGSSIGNFARSEAADFAGSFTNALGDDDRMLICIDGCKDPDKVYSAYNDRAGVTRQFTLNGLVHANQILGDTTFDVAQWNAIGEFDASAGCHQAFVTPVEDVFVCGVTVRGGERVKLEESFKYDHQDLEDLWRQAGIQVHTVWENVERSYGMHLVAKKQYGFPLAATEYASSPTPTWKEWHHLWGTWDVVTREMIPDDELVDKPIKLRNACIFYLGHIPTFFDMKLSEATKTDLTDPKHFAKIFERGIDPDVENPELVHSHSEIPDQWPSLDEIMAHQGRVRERVRSLYECGTVKDARVARCLWLGYEHECMHLETLLYMLVQSKKMLPPPRTLKPSWEALADHDARAAVRNEWITVDAKELTIGINDPETNDGHQRYFGWDVEKPARTTHVPTFEAKARPMTNGEFALFLQQSGRQDIPASWEVSNEPVIGKANGTVNGSLNGSVEKSTNSETTQKGALSSHFLSGKSVRTVYGLVPLAHTLHWPVAASYDELSRCATFMGGRIPSLEEARSLYAQVPSKSVSANSKAHQALGRTIPAVNSHLVNNGVPESPPSSGETKTAGAGIPAPPRDGDGGGTGLAKGANLDPHDLFVDLDGCNVGFNNWHPTAITQKGSNLCGQGDMGGVWEWTSTPLHMFEGYEPMPLYPAYSRDFFDGKHNIVLGGSWATPPRLAGRKSFINWYQHNYPYVWAGARLVRDVQ